MKRHALIAGNWKMNGTHQGAVALATAIAKAPPPVAELALCPPFIHIAAVKVALGQSNVALGAQDVTFRADGAYTGDISAAMLADAGCKYVIVGHSERREHHKESDQLVASKASVAIDSGIIPIICVGETLAQREAGQTQQVVEAQIAGSVPANATGQNVVIAYEPVWAIGTGLTATNAQIAEVHGQIRGLLEKRLAAGGDLRIIYGGSVKPENASDILLLEDVDGALVGGASLKADSFLAIANSAKV